MLAVTWKNTRFGGMGVNQIQANSAFIGNTALRYLFLIKEHALFRELTVVMAGTAFT